MLLHLGLLHYINETVVLFSNNENVVTDDVKHLNMTCVMIDLTIFDITLLLLERN